MKQISVTSSRKRWQQGFTVIELVTVVGITAIVSVVSVAVLVTSQVRSTRATVINRVRGEGSFSMDTMAFILRNARYLEENQSGQTCSPSMSSIRVRDVNGGLLELYATEDLRIASNSGTVITDPPAAYLTSPDVRIESLSFTCVQEQSQRGARVGISMTLSSGNPDTLSPESYYSQMFETQVYIRSYR